MRRILHQYQPLIGGLALLFALLAARMAWHGSFRFAFLVWNVFLAVLPLLFAHCATHAGRAASRWLCAALWLLFFPNAAYLVTDIVHLSVRDHPGFWLDLVLLFGGGLYGIVLGLHSLRIMERWYSRMLPARAAMLVTIAVLLLSGYGIYLGRVERWNSWDVVLNTGDLLTAIAYQVRHPLRCIEVWGLSGIFAAALGLSYLALGKRLGQE
jgi:uncharacterized membrane protein